MKCPYQTIITHKPERFGYDAQDITTFGECCETECPFYYLSGKIESCRKAESEGKNDKRT